MAAAKTPPQARDGRRQFSVRIPVPVWRQVRNLSLDTGITAANHTAIALAEYLERAGYMANRETTQS